MTFIKKQSQPYSPERLYNYAIWLISRKDYTVHELMTKMKKHQENINMCQAVIIKLQTQGYQSDDRVIRAIYNAYSHKEGETKLKQRMMLKGINKQLIQEFFDTLEPSENNSVVDNIYQLLVKKYKTFCIEKQSKMISFLMSRGFEYSDIKKAVDIFKKNDA